MQGQVDLLTQATAISASLQLIIALLKILAGVISGTAVIISSVVVYAYKKNNEHFISELGHVDKKAQVALDKTDEMEIKMDNERDRVDRDFLSVQSHDRICPGKAN